MTARPTGNDKPIGIFDSGIGGLSILRHIHQLMPQEHLLYFADSAYAPYGGKPEQAIVERTLAIADFLLGQGCKALVVACNTATAAAIRGLRERYPSLLLVGVEPGLKPAAMQTQTRIVGVLATERTLASAKFTVLQEQIEAASGVRFLLQPCIGLADQIEKGELRSLATAALVNRYVAPLIKQGADTLVLGCTHYPFLHEMIEAAANRIGGQPVKLVDTAEAVAKQLSRLLTAHDMQHSSGCQGSLAGFTTGSRTALVTAFGNLLKLQPQVTEISAASDTGI